jgi:hypothetical protein
MDLTEQKNNYVAQSWLKQSVISLQRMQLIPFIWYNEEVFHVLMDLTMKMLSLTRDMLTQGMQNMQFIQHCNKNFTYVS